jgi:hypothetical protein
MPALTTDSDETPPDHGDRDETADPGVADAANALTRVTVNLRRPVVVALDRLIATTGYPKTDIINQGILALAVLRDIMNRNGGNIVVLMDNGDVERIHIL